MATQLHAVRRRARALPRAGLRGRGAAVRRADVALTGNHEIGADDEDQTADEWVGVRRNPFGPCRFDMDGWRGQWQLGRRGQLGRHATRRDRNGDAECDASECARPRSLFLHVLSDVDHKGQYAGSRGWEDLLPVFPLYSWRNRHGVDASERNVRHRPRCAGPRARFPGRSAGQERHPGRRRLRCRLSRRAWHGKQPVHRHRSEHGRQRHSRSERGNARRADCAWHVLVQRCGEGEFPDRYGTGKPLCAGGKRSVQARMDAAEQCRHLCRRSGGQHIQRCGSRRASVQRLCGDEVAFKRGECPSRQWRRVGGDSPKHPVSGKGVRR